MSKFVTVLLWIVGVFAVVCIVGMAWAYAGVGKGRGLKIGEADLASLADGKYRGSYSGGRFSTEVEVTVADHRITDITIVKDMFGNAAATHGQKIIEAVMAKQSLSVDTVSGATATTKAYLKAVENALKGVR